jgi:hypothetical protein
MFEETVSKNAKNGLAVLGKSGVLKDAYLAGGTALSLQLGHRISLDFDFFTRKKFDAKLVVQKLAHLPVHFELERTTEGTILGYVTQTKFSLFLYTYPLLGSPQKFLGVNVASIKDIAPMKIAAVSDRGTKRDFIDLYCIIAVYKHCTLEEALRFYDKKFKLLHQNKLHILKSLIYFEDAEKERMPRMLKSVDWKDVKRFFETEVKRLSAAKIL